MNLLRTTRGFAGIAVSLLVAVAAALLAVSNRAQASLGDTVASVERDRQALHVKSDAAVSQKDSYQVYELVTGVRTVREYIAGSGNVFAVTWTGLSHPDLTSLLGTYFREFSDADSRVPVKRGVPLRKVQSDHVVVEKSGHMGRIKGRAYAPELVPADVDAQSLL